MSTYAEPLPPPPELPRDTLRLYRTEMGPHAHRIILILDAKQVKYEVVKVNPWSIPEWFIDKSPNLILPVLEVPTNHGDKCLFGSVIICEYLDEVYGSNPLHSKDPIVKAQDRLLIERFNELISGILEIFNYTLACSKDPIMQTLALFEMELTTRGTPFFGSSRPGMLDYMIWPWIERLYLIRCDNENKYQRRLLIFPSMANWAGKMHVDEIVKKHKKSPEEYFIYYMHVHLGLDNYIGINRI